VKISFWLWFFGGAAGIFHFSTVLGTADEAELGFF
jgi:hypothetical protein